MAEIEKLRTQIDNTDKKIIELIEKRSEIVKEIGRLKSLSGRGIYDPIREYEVLEKVSKTNLDKEFIRKLFRDIMKYCRTGEKKLIKKMSEKKYPNKLKSKSIAILGPEGTFTEIAARKIFKNSKFIYCDNVEEVFSKVESHIEYGVVAIENSLEGSVSKTMDCLIEYYVKVCGEITLDIDLCIVTSKKTKRENIKAIISHPHALAQCQNYIKKNFPTAKLINSTSTAAAMLELKKIKNSAAIGPKESAKKYKLSVIGEHIQDDVSQTRFIVIGKESKRGKKTSIIFAAKDEPGSLYRVLREFAKRNINLTKIESRPSKRKLGEYLFFVDFESKGMSENKIKEALDSIRPKITFLKVLGSY